MARRDRKPPARVATPCTTKPPRPPTSTTTPPLGQSSVDKLPPELREAVNAAVADGATIDEITALIKGAGGDCSRSAVGRYAQKHRAMLREQRESDRVMTLWMKEFGDRGQGQAGLVLIETMRTMVLGTMAAFAERAEPVPMQELARLSLVLKRIEDTDRLPLAREAAAEKAADAAKPEPRKGLSPETVAMIDEAVLGGGPVACADRHLGAGGPVESCGIPLDPTQSRRILSGNRSAGVSHQPHVDPVPRARVRCGPRRP